MSDDKVKVGYPLIENIYFINFIITEFGSTLYTNQTI